MSTLYHDLLCTIPLLLRQVMFFPAASSLSGPPGGCSATSGAAFTCHCLEWPRQRTQAAVGARLYFNASGKQPYRTRSWYDFPWAARRVPVEPMLKFVLPFIGINAELWAGHVSYRPVLLEFWHMLHSQGDSQQSFCTSCNSCFQSVYMIDLEYTTVNKPPEDDVNHSAGATTSCIRLAVSY